MPPSIRTDDLLQELDSLSRALETIVGALPGTPRTESDVWSVYAGLEKVVAVLKFRLKQESPGVFRELPKSAVPVSLLPPALEAVKEGRSMLESKEFPEALESLRVGRDNLRAYLSEQRKARARVKRRSAARPSS
ncbi:MAG: hypothetical protein OK456_03670 [Thaumarchaeota archaeon]|nr:hypothetical protein [Nitrososphaerota archaeon]